MQGPRISGSVHGTGDDRLIVATVRGGGFQGSWQAKRDDRPEIGQPAAAPSPDDLVEQLAFRILADLAPIGSPRWRAVRSYTRGLAAYRETQRTARDKSLLLGDAERHLLAAREADDRFARCHYNLGVVYLEMGRLESAEIAFQRAFQEGHPAAEACLALASIHFQRRRNAAAIRFCDAALGADPDQPKSWSLRGLALRREREQELAGQAFEADDPRWRPVAESREVAMALAWRRLCAAATAGKPPPELRDVARAAAVNLAVVYAQIGRYRDGERILFQAIHLAPDDQDLRHELGKIRFSAGDLAGAAAAFHGAQEDVLDSGRCTDQLLLTLVSREALARTPGRREARRAADRAAAAAAYRRLLDRLGDTAVVERLDRMGIPARLLGPSVARLRAVAALHLALARGEDEAYDAYRERLGRVRGRLAELLKAPAETDEAHLDRLAAFGGSLAQAPAAADFRAADLPAVAAWLAGTAGEPVEPRAERRAALAAAAAHDWAWLDVQSDLRLAAELQKTAPGIDDPYTSEDLLEPAIARLEAWGSDQPRSQGLHGQIVSACIAQLSDPPSVENAALLGSALVHAERAVRLSPESADDHFRLGWVHLLFAHFERAEAELRLSRSLAPGDPQVMQSIAQRYWNLGVDRRDHASRRAAFEEVIKLLGHSLRLNEAQKASAEQLQLRGWTHYWLGRFHVELRHFDEGRSSLQIALQMGFKRLESRIALARAYLDERAYALARASFRDALRELRRQRRAILAGGAPASGWAAQPVDPPDGELTLNAALLEIELGRAELDLESGCGLERAERLLRWAARRIPRIAKAIDRNEYRALYREAQAGILLRRGRPADALRRLRQALETSDRASVYRTIARCHLALARDGDAEPEPACTAARDACLRARAADLRELEGERIDELLAEIERVRAASAPLARPS